MWTQGRVSMSDRINRAAQPTKGFSFARFLGPDETWSPLPTHDASPLLQDSPPGRRQPHTPRSCAPDRADASNISHPQLLPSLRSGSGQIPASVRLGVCSSACAHRKRLLTAERSRPAATAGLRAQGNISTLGSQGTGRHTAHTLPGMSWGTSKLAGQINPQPPIPKAETSG